jgi:molecular chaperone DnaJ
MFGDMFGRQRGGRGRRQAPEPAAGDDIEAAIEVDLRDAVLGADREISLERPATCPECKGSGVKPGSRPHTCPQCGGSGEVRMGGMFSAPCPRCQGEGTIRDPCPRCGGDGTIPETVRLKVKIPAGVETGSRVRLPGQGAPGERGADPGDLYLRIAVRPHPSVRVDGRDFLLDLPITPAEALGGGEVTAPTFEGAVKLKIPPGSQSGRKLRLRGRGLPALKGGSTGAPRGDLYVVLQIVLPPDSPEARAAAGALQGLYKSDVRRDVVL